MEKQYYAVPVLVYIPVEDITNELEAELLIMNHMNQLNNASTFIAEDFQTTIQTETDDEDLSGMIGAACEEF